MIGGVIYVQRPSIPGTISKQPDNITSVHNGTMLYLSNSIPAMVTMEPKKTFTQYVQSNQLANTSDKLPITEDDKTHILATRGQAQTRELIGELEVTAYSEYGPVSSDGSMAGPGKVAVDPLCIPYGTKLAIEGYGEAVAADSGRLIKGITPGQKIWNPRLKKYERLANVDVWFSTKAEALKWGRRVVKVYKIGE